MADNIIALDMIRKSGPGGRSLPVHNKQKRDDLTGELQLYMHTLGPKPKRCLESLSDIGLSDSEIARYFKIPTSIVTALRLVWNIDGEA